MFTVHTSRITTRRTTAAFSDLLLLIPLVGLYAWAGSTRRRGEEDSWLFNQNHLTTVVEEGWKKGGVAIAFCSAEPARYGCMVVFHFTVYLFIYQSLSLHIETIHLIQTSLNFLLEFLFNTRSNSAHQLHPVPLQSSSLVLLSDRNPAEDIRQANAASEFDRI